MQTTIKRQVTVKKQSLDALIRDLASKSTRTFVSPTGGKKGFDKNWDKGWNKVGKP